VVRSAGYLRDMITRGTGFELDITDDDYSPGDNQISLTLTETESGLGQEGYTLEADSSAIVIRADKPAGLFYGIQTLRQIWPPILEREKGGDNAGLTIPCVRIRDIPRFGWRGLMLDCSRTFWDTDTVKRYIDLLALLKMNVFHLHLTDDQGWRVEISKYPRLTEVGSKFDPRYEGEINGYYSRDDIKDIVAYAADRNITIVPELDLPGHFTAALAAYPELSCTGRTDLWIYPFFKRPEGIAPLTEDILCAGDEKSYRFLEDVLGELVELFPSRYIHIGGDEAPKARWEHCKKCQAMIRKHGLKDEHELQSHMTKFMADYLESKGRKLIGWDEIMEGGLAGNAAVMYWRGWIEEAPLTALGQDNEVVMSPTTHCYFDYTYEKISTEHAYSYEPIPPGLRPDQERLILGVQANMWTHIARDRDALDSQIFPRLAAIAEVGWSPKEARDWSRFKQRLGPLCERLNLMGVSCYISR